MRWGGGWWCRSFCFSRISIRHITYCLLYFCGQSYHVWKSKSICWDNASMYFWKDAMRNENFVSVDPLVAYELFGTVLGNCSMLIDEERFGSWTSERDSLLDQRDEITLAFTHCTRKTSHTGTHPNTGRWVTAGETGHQSHQTPPGLLASTPLSLKLWLHNNMFSLNWLFSFLWVYNTYDWYYPS